MSARHVFALTDHIRDQGAISLRVKSSFLSTKYTSLGANLPPKSFSRTARSSMLVHLLTDSPSVAHVLQWSNNWILFSNHASILRCFENMNEIYINSSQRSTPVRFERVSNIRPTATLVILAHGPRFTTQRMFRANRMPAHGSQFDASVWFTIRPTCMLLPSSTSVRFSKRLVIIMWNT